MNKKLIKFLTIGVIVICMMAGLAFQALAYGSISDLCEEYSSCYLECCKSTVARSPKRPDPIDYPPNSHFIPE